MTRTSHRVKKKNYSPSDNMKIISIDLNNVHAKALDVLTAHGAYNSRSEAIRVSLHDFFRETILHDVKCDEELGIEQSTNEIINLIDELKKNVVVGEKKGTCLVSVNIPKIYKETIRSLVDNDVYDSRSKLIRFSLDRFLKKELELLREMLKIKHGTDIVERRVEKSTRIDMRKIRTGW